MRPLGEPRVDAGGGAAGGRGSKIESPRPPGQDADEELSEKIMVMGGGGSSEIYLGAGPLSPAGKAASISRRASAVPARGDALFGDADKEGCEGLVFCGESVSFRRWIFFFFCGVREGAAVVILALCGEVIFGYLTFFLLIWGLY